MTWNYRIIRNAPGDYSINEVYYSKLGKPIAMSAAIAPFGESVKEVEDDMGLMMMALTKLVFVPTKRWGK